jgi:peroxiredoxin
MASPAAAAAALLLRPPSCLPSVCASRTPLLAVASHRVKYRTILRGSARECFSSFLGASSFSRRSAVLQPELKNKKRRVTTVRGEVMESQSASMTRAPDFELPEPLTGKTWKLDDFEAYPALLVMFICNHCPYVIHLKEDIVKLANNYMPKGLAVVAISSNCVETHPQDGPSFMAEEATTYKYPFPYLYDETQEVAKAYGAVCTPDFYLFKKDGRRPFELVYHGRFDDSRPRSNTPITGRDIREALDCTLSGRPVSGSQKPSIGCSIKWAPASRNY